MRIRGDKIELRAAEESDRKKVYLWLAQSDISPSIFLEDLPTPSWEEFCEDYTLQFFNQSGNGKGRSFIITVDGHDAGMISYDLLDQQRNQVVLDIWMCSEKYCGCGYGSDALKTLCCQLKEIYGITNFIICPSARNKRAVASYRKAGFEYIRHFSKEEQIEEFGKAEYDDNVLMIKKL